MLYTVIVVAAQIGLALLIAGLLQPLPARGQAFYRALFYLPLVNSAILVAMVWRWIFNPNPFGLANAVLNVFGLGPYRWIGSSDEAMAAVILSTVLIIPGGGVVLYSAAMGGIPKSCTKPPMSRAPAGTPSGATSPSRSYGRRRCT